MALVNGLLSGLENHVGNGKANREKDVAKIRSGLAYLNYKTEEDKAEGIYTRPFLTQSNPFKRMRD
ncbi:MAG: hypothetical protein JWM96_634 [Alphaproteobacteria bacterium]|nr:hypothetical protein [Alphaproteobacteria bacterium]